jgi:hypothetical protein
LVQIHAASGDASPIAQLIDEIAEHIRSERDFDNDSYPAEAALVSAQLDKLFLSITEDQAFLETANPRLITLKQRLAKAIEDKATAH